MVRAAELYDLIPIVRVPCQEASLLGANFSDAKVWPLVAISAARGTGPRTTLSPEPRLRPVLCRS